MGLVVPFSDVMLLSPGNLDVISTTSSSGRHSPSYSCDSLVAFGRIYYVFYVKMNSDPAVDVPFAVENLDRISTSPLYLAVTCSQCSCDSSRWLLDEFHAFSP